MVNKVKDSGMQTKLLDSIEGCIGENIRQWVKECREYMKLIDLYRRHLQAQTRSLSLAQ